MLLLIMKDHNIISNEDFNSNANFYDVNGIIELKYKDFNIKNKKVYVKNKKFKENKSIIIFYAPWCSHCKEIRSQLEELSLTNLNKFQIGTVNTSDQKNKNYLLSHALGIKYIPETFVVKKDNQLIPFGKSANYENLFYYINMNID